MPTFAGLTWTVVPAVKDAIGWAAVIAVLGLFLAPVKDIWGGKGAFKAKSTENLATGFPYFASFYNCLLWVLYATADLPRLLQPLVINIIGMTLHASFLSVYWRYAKDDADRKSCLTAFLGGAATVALAAYLSAVSGSAQPFGNVAMVVNVVMYYSPLAALGTVLKERSVAKMPFAPLLMTFIGSSLWFTFGMYIFDAPIFIPNVIGILFGIGQLVLYAHISAGEKKRAAEGDAASGSAGTAPAALPSTSTSSTKTFHTTLAYRPRVMIPPKAAPIRPHTRVAPRATAAARSAASLRVGARIRHAPRMRMAVI